MRVMIRTASLTTCKVGLLCATLLLASCGGSSSSGSKPTTPSVVGSVVPNSSYELDAFDIQGNYAYVLGDNGNQGASGSSTAAAKQRSSWRRSRSSSTRNASCVAGANCAPVTEYA